MPTISGNGNSWSVYRQHACVWASDNEHICLDQADEEAKEFALAISKLRRALRYGDVDVGEARQRLFEEMMDLLLTMDFLQDVLGVSSYDVHTRLDILYDGLAAKLRKMEQDKAGKSDGNSRTS